MLARLRPVVAALALAIPASAHAEEKRPRFEYPPILDGARVERYKEADGSKLNAWTFEPKETADAGAKRPAIVFFFGGGWSSGSPVQFERQCRHFATRGMVAITADYRVATRQHVKPPVCVSDAKSCIRWVRQNAGRLGIDPERIVAAGGSAGGHLAAATATLPGFDQPGEDTSVSPVPNALVLFNPVVMFAPFKEVEPKGFARSVNVEKLGCEPAAISPIHHLRQGVPPTLILHGRADSTVPTDTIEAFAAEMKSLGNRCELAIFDGQSHGFFNAAKYDETVAAADQFLVSLGYIPKR